MSSPGCQKMWVKPCHRNAEERFPVLSLKSREQKPPNHLLIQDKDVLQPSMELPGFVAVRGRRGNGAPFVRAGERADQRTADGFAPLPCIRGEGRPPRRKVDRSAYDIAL